MKNLEKQERAEKLLKQMSDVFYDVVPETYKTYCVLVSSIAKFALQANGLDAKLPYVNCGTQTLRLTMPLALLAWTSLVSGMGT
jgi:hypothetical protein